MHSIESYATKLGLKIDKPSILENYYPMGEFKYITLCIGNSSNDSLYKCWQDAINLMFPILESKGIKIIQLNSELNQKFDNCINLQEKISPNKSAYIIKNSELHVSEMGLDLELASSYDKNIIYLNDSNKKFKNYPFWNKDSKHVCLNESKNINKIKPEDIAKRVFNFLEIDFKIDFETVFIGENYQNKSIQFIPDQNADIVVPTNQVLITRMDKFFDEQNLIKQLSQHKCIIVTNKKINLSLLKQFKNSIVNLVFFIEDKDDPDFIDEIQSMGIPYVLMSYLEEKILQDKKINYLDNGLISRIDAIKKEDLEELKDLDISSLYYISNGPVLSNFKVYKSIFDYDTKNNVENPSIPSLIKENEEFWREIHNFHILKKIDTNLN